MELIRGAPLSKIAMSDRHGENSPYFDGWKAYDNNPFHLTRNPGGVIQMGLAENQLCFDLVEEWIKQNPKASICTSDGVGMFKDIAIFQDYHGLPEFRQGVAKLMERLRGGKVKFDPDRIVMSGGATGANETLMFCLANRGDAFLVPSPYYPAFTRDLRWRTGIELIPIHCKSSNGFRLTLEDLESAYSNARKDFPSTNIKGLILTNPSNPLGTTLGRDTLQRILTFVSEKNIHLVCDEIYSGTVFKAPGFVSFAEFLEEDSKIINRELVHIVYSLSKDMGFPGLRVGIVYSYNDHVVSCARKMSSFGLVSSQTQHMLAAMLSDEDFMGRFLEESSKRLGKRYNIFIKGLEQVGITCLDSNAGLFFWMDLRHLLKDHNSFEAEMQLWRLIINDVKLNVSPGSSFCCTEPGFFRVCFANMDDQTVEIALQRIIEFVNRDNDSIPGRRAMKKRSNWQNNHSLRLSISSSRGGFDSESILSPHRMSPHSPIPHSPLVRARN